MAMRRQRVKGGEKLLGCVNGGGVGQLASKDYRSKNAVNQGGGGFVNVRYRQLDLFHQRKRTGCSSGSSARKH